MTAIETVEFWCPIADGSSKFCEKLLLPAECCGRKVVVNTNYVAGVNSGSNFISTCTKHMGQYSAIWKNFGPGGLMEVNPTPWNPPTKYGYKCERCKDYNPYAEANQPDDKFLCYSCNQRVKSFTS